MSVELVLQLVGILVSRVAQAVAGGFSNVDVDDLFIGRTAEDALNELRAKRG